MSGLIIAPGSMQDFRMDYENVIAKNRGETGTQMAMLDIK